MQPTSVENEYSQLATVYPTWCVGLYFGRMSLPISSLPFSEMGYKTCQCMGFFTPFLSLSFIHYSVPFFLFFRMDIFLLMFSIFTVVEVYSSLVMLLDGSIFKTYITTVIS